MKILADFYDTLLDKVDRDTRTGCAWSFEAIMLDELTLKRQWKTGRIATGIQDGNEGMVVR